MRQYLKPHEAAELDALIRGSIKVLDCEKPPEWFHRYQLEAWEATTPIIAICAGWQSGKTVFLPNWLKREIQRKGPGDYGAFSTTYKLLNRKFLPELKTEFKHLAVYHKADMQFVFTEAGSRMMWGDQWDGTPTVIQLGYAENPDSLESATMKAVVWDEPGQRLVPEQSFLTVQSRLMVNRGRMCLSSRPYEFNWFQKLVQAGLTGTDNNVKVVSFPSWANPVNPKEDDPYWEDLRRSTAPWQFTMLYEGKFTRPAGAIYDIFDSKVHCIPRFDIPKDWERVIGLDFGPNNTCAVFFARDPVRKRWIIYRVYLQGGRSVEQHVYAIRRGEPKKLRCYGGAHHEQEAREAYTMAGLPCQEPPINDVFEGIKRGYGAYARRELFMFSDLKKLVAETETYAYELDDDGEPTEKIQNKSKFHRCDAKRYGSSAIWARTGVARIRSRYEKARREAMEDDD